MVSEINSLTNKTICSTFIVNCTSFENMHVFYHYYKYAMKNNVQDKMHISYFLMASKNIEFDHVCHVIVYR